MYNLFGVVGFMLVIMGWYFGIKYPTSIIVWIALVLGCGLVGAAIQMSSKANDTKRKDF